MSRDVAVNCHTCGSVLNHAKTTLPGGVGGLLKAIGAPVDEWNGRKAVDVLPRLGLALRHLENDEDDLREEHDTDMERPDAWSRVDFVGPFLKELLYACCTDPEATISIWP